MLASGLAETRHQHFIVGLEKHELATDARFLEITDQPWHAIYIVGTIPCIEPNADILEYAVLAVEDVLDEGVEEAGRDVVYTIEIEILERVQGYALARARKSANDNQTHLCGSRDQRERALLASRA